MEMGFGDSPVVYKLSVEDRHQRSFVQRFRPASRICSKPQSTEKTEDVQVEATGKRDKRFRPQSSKCRGFEAETSNLR